MLIALILILTWPSPCIQALYLIAVLLAAGEQSKAQHQAQSTKQSHHQAQSTKHKAEPSPAISHQPSEHKHPSPITHHRARQHRTEAQAPITKHVKTITHICLYSTSCRFWCLSFNFIFVFLLLLFLVSPPR